MNSLRISATASRRTNRSRSAATTWSIPTTDPVLSGGYRDSILAS